MLIFGIIFNPKEWEIDYRFDMLEGFHIEIIFGPMVLGYVPKGKE